MNDHQSPLTGGCGCGAVRFEVAAPLVDALYCHCQRCQRRSGTAASANAIPKPGSFRLLSGEGSLRAWKPAGGWEKWFCAECGSAVFSRHPENGDRMSIRLGAFDGDPGIRPSRRQFVAYAAPWEPIPDDGLPRHSGSAFDDDSPCATSRAGLDHFDLVVTDLERSLRFYRGLLGPLGWTAVVSITGERGEPVHHIGGEPPNRPMTLSLRQALSDAHPVPYDRYAVGLHHLAFSAPSRAAVDDRHGWLVEHGAAIESAPREYDYTPGYYAVFLYDPDGIKLEIVHKPTGN